MIDFSNRINLRHEIVSRNTFFAHIHGANVNILKILYSREANERVQRK